MTLNPEAEHVLRCLEERNFARTHTLPLEQVRKAHLLRRQCYGNMTGSPVRSVRDLSIAGPHEPLPLRLYEPAASTGAVIVFFHGGGFVNGSIETHDYICRAVTNAVPAIVVSVGYRRAPETRFPGAAEDCYAALHWVSTHPSDLPRFDRLLVCGDSAGGNLAAATALMARDRDGPALAGQALLYPVLDGANFDRPSYRDNAVGYLLTRDAMRWLWTKYLPDAAEAHHPYASPVHADRLDGLPPALIVTAEYDPLRDEGEAYAAQLAAAGIPVTTCRFPGMIHGFMEIPLITSARPRALELLAAFVQGLHTAPGLPKSTP